MRRRNVHLRASVVFALTAAMSLASPGVGHAVSVREATIDLGSTDVNDVAIDPNNQSRVYCSVDYASEVPGACYVSEDYGTSWNSMEPELPEALRYGRVELETVGSTLFAGNRVGATRGIFRSYTLGSTWSRLTTLGSLEGVMDIAYDPSNRKHVFAVTERSDGALPNLYYTLDGGQTWNVRKIAVPGSECRVALAVEVGAQGRLLVGAQNIRWVDGPTGGGVFVTDDAGATWTRSGCVDLDTTDIAVCPTNRRLMYACAGLLGEKPHLYKSTNNGDTWTQVPMPSRANPTTVEVDSLGRVFVGSGLGWPSYGGLHQSTDGGEHWTQIGSFATGQGAVTSELDRAGAYLYIGRAKGLTRYWVPSAEEIFGENRYLTAIQTSRTRFPTSNTAGCVVVVSGVNFPDATVAAPFAAANNGTILLSREDGLDASTMKEIDRLLPSGGDVYVIGGTAAVPGTVDTSLKAKGYKVERIAGRDRYATSAAVASELGTCTACFVANGAAFPDVLSASAPAADFGMPILLTRTDAVSSSVEKYLDANTDTLETAYIAGDTTVVGASVASDLGDYTDDVVRLGGHTRYDTSLVIAKRFYPVPTKAAGVATGELYPDGLTGSILCAYRGGPLVLTRSDDLPASIASYLKSGKPDQVTVFGGRAAVTIEARHELEGLW